MSFDAKNEAVGSVEAIDTDGRCAAARVNRVLSCLRSLTVAPSQQARLMLSDHQDRRHPCPSVRVCVSLRPDQPCQHPGARLARCVRLKIPSLTGRFPVAAKIEVNRSALVHVRGASPPARKRAIRRNLASWQYGFSDCRPMSMLWEVAGPPAAESAASTKHRHPLWAPEGLLKARCPAKVRHWHHWS